MTDYALGIDISKYQIPPLDWHAYKAGGYDFAIVRATQGSATSKPEGNDPQFVRHVNDILASHEVIRLGVYHAFLPAVDGVTQARFFWANVKAYLPIMAFPLAVDVEVTNDRAPSVISARLYNMCRELERLSGAQPMIYTSPGFWGGSVGNEKDWYFSSLPLWVANWTTRKAPLLPRGWSSWKVWQYTSNGLVPGYRKRVDVNRMVKS